MTAAMMLLASLAAFAQADSYSKVSVTHHTIRMDLSDFEGHQIRGNAELQVKSKEKKLKAVPLNLLQMTVDSVFVNGKESSSEYDGEVLSVNLPKKLGRGREASIRVVYHGEPVSRRFGGFSWFSEQRMAHNMGVSINDIPHSYAKAWYPAVDDFRARSTYDLIITTPSDLTAVGNGLLQNEPVVSGSSKTWHWTMSKPIPDYLGSVAVGPYITYETSYTNGSRELPVVAYVTKDEYEGAAACYGIMPAVLKALENRFGEYPFDRVGYVSVNSPGGAMEHASNISMPRKPSALASYQEMAIHELIHSWFGNLVTCLTPGDMWLNEGITTYVVEVVLEDLAAEGLIPDDQVQNYRKTLDRIAGMIPKDNPRYHALAGTPETDTYGSIVYYKGGWVMRQLRHKLGDEIFFKAMKQYVKEFSWSNASTEDFKASLEASTGTDLTEFFNEYVYS